MIIRSTALTQFVRYSVLCLFINLCFAVASEAANAVDQLTVREFAGAVKLKVDDRWQDPEVDMVVDLPATVSTGEDGSIELVQGGTVYSVAANTALELLAGPEPGQLVRRVVQSKGSAFYDVSKREQQKLRVETPYLVAVIKGTQFNVTVERESASISLFEGLLQIEAPDIDQVIDLKAGFIARRHKDDTSITVIRMDNGEPVAGSRLGSNPRDSGGAAGPRGDEADNHGDDIPIPAGDGTSGGGTTDRGAGDGLVGGGAGGGPEGTDIPSTPEAGDNDVEEELSADIDLGGSDIGAGIVADVGSDHLILEATSTVEVGDIGAGLDAGVDADLGSGDIGVDLGADVSVGDDIGVGLDAGVDADLGSGDIGVDVGADAGVGDIGVGLDAGVDADLGSGDLGVDLGADATVGDDLGLGVDAGVDADLGSGDLGVDLGADATVGDDLGVGVDAGVDADLGSGDIGVDLGADADVGDIDAGLDAGVDTDLGSGGLGADLGADATVGDDLGLGLDAGVDADLGSGDIGVDLGADADVGGIDTGLDVGVDADLGSGDIGLDVGLGDTGLDVGLDDGGLDVGLDLGGLDDTLDLADDLLGGEDTGTDDTGQEEEEEEDVVLPLPDLGDLLGL